MIKGRNVEEDCPIISAVGLLSRKWVLYILTELIESADNHKGMFFSEIQKNTQDKYGSKISSRVLSDCLSSLESEGLVNRKVMENTVPVRVEYSLTDKGYDLKVVLSVLKGWGTKYGGLKQKVCLNFSCVHDAVPILNTEQAWDLLIDKDKFKADSFFEES